MEITHFHLTTPKYIRTILPATIFLLNACDVHNTSSPELANKPKNISTVETSSTASSSSSSAIKSLPLLSFKDLGLNRPVNNTPPITADELTVATDAYITLLKGTRYFNVLDERIHGWPESNPSKPPFGIWWIGVQLERRSGQVVYRHHEIGSDNAAADTGAILENLCYAQRFLGDGIHTKTLVRTARGLAALSKAMRSKRMPNNGTMLARSFYPESVESRDHDTPVLFDYSRARPGQDNSATEYVNISDNPHWGNIWIKNKRSKDDMGHVMRALSQTSQTCNDILDNQSKSTLDEAKSSHMLWAQKVLNDGGTIATLDKNLKVYWPFETLARFISIGGIECTAYLALNLFSSGGTGGYDCGDGTNSAVDWLAQFNDQNLPLVESYHLASMSAALEYNRLPGAKQLGAGIMARLNSMIQFAASNNWSDSYHPEHLSALMLRSTAMGIPLQNNEVRWLQKQIIKAKDVYLSARKDHLYDFLNKKETDGIYPYTPHGEGLLWRDIGAVIGTCSSVWRAQSGAKIVDCERLRRELTGT